MASLSDAELDHEIVVVCALLAFLRGQRPPTPA
jgi:hypothetical protein